MKKTNRGFKIYSEMKDSYGNSIRVQQSSAACIDACWIFTNGKDGSECAFDSATQRHIAVSPHLTKAQARRLAKALLKFSEAP